MRHIAPVFQRARPVSQRSEVDPAPAQVIVGGRFRARHARIPKALRTLAPLSGIRRRLRLAPLQQLAVGLTLFQVHARDPGILLQHPQRFAERQLLMIHQEVHRIAVRLTAEAMVETLVVVDREAGRAFGVERAQAEPVGALLRQLHHAPDQRREFHPRAYRIHLLP